MNLDILFLGRLFPREKEAEIKTKMKTGMQDAANALQWNIIDGFEKNNCGSIKILNYLPIDSYPNGYADKDVEEFIFQHTDKYKADDINVGINNRTVIKQFVNKGAFKHKIKKWAEKSSNGKKVLMLYTAHDMFLSLAKYAKKLNTEIETVCVIADIPEFATARDLHGIHKLYSTYATNKCANLYKYIDKFVLLTKQMAEKLEIKSPFSVVEGIAPSPDTECDSSLYEKYKDEKYVLYTGTLNYKFGIGTLLEAFDHIDDKELKLMICGFGEAEEIIKKRMENDENIIFLGRVDRKAVLPLQRGATVLVNPRQNNEEFTKYSFPSKTMEYLASGVPVVAYKLDGIPDEYDEYINYVPDNSPESLAKVIQSISKLPKEERSLLGIKASDFVLEEKNYIAQTKKILHFILQQ